MSNDAIIATESLTKRFGRSLALDGVDLRVAAGEVHGFLGPNGAGKSTTIRVLLGLLRPSGGTARVFGMDAWRESVAIHRRLASVPGDVSLWPQLTGGEAIDVLTRLRGGKADSAERARLIDAFELDTRKRCRSCSKGNRQKVALIAAFATAADLYMFDEPTSGLDPLMEQVFRAEVARIRDRGATVLLSSHILSEVEQLCTRVSIIRAGRIVETGTLDQLRHLRRSEVRFRGASASASLPLHDVVAEGDQTHASVEPDDLPEVLAWLGARGVTDVSVQPTSLEQLFLQHYESERS